MSEPNTAISGHSSPIFVSSTFLMGCGVLTLSNNVPAWCFLQCTPGCCRNLRQPDHWHRLYPFILTIVGITGGLIGTNTYPHFFFIVTTPLLHSTYSGACHWKCNGKAARCLLRWRQGNPPPPDVCCDGTRSRTPRLIST